MRTAKITGKEMLLLTFIALSLSMAACEQQTEVVEYDIKGHRALTISFWDNFPPGEVYEESDFSIKVDLENTGTHDIEDGIINTFVEEEYVYFDSEEDRFKSFQLEGKDKYYPGEKTTESVMIRTRDIGDIKARDTRLTVNLCYDYNTHFSETICIDANPAGYNSQKSCAVEEIVTPQGQGAPIAVSSISEISSPSGENTKIIFEIKIENKGYGTVIDQEDIDKICGEADPSTSIEEDDLNIIEIEEIRFSNYRLSEGDLACKPSALNVFENNMVRCTAEIPKSLGAFSTELTIDLAYGYMETLTKDIKIKKI